VNFFIKKEKSQLRDIIIIDDFSNQEIEHIFRIADDMANIISSGSPRLCNGKIMSTLFYEPSTRTRLSFESAMIRLGGNVIGFAEPGSSSVAKGETLADTARVVSEYADVIVIRHPYAGAAKVVADYSEIPVINGGDGSHQHPTQTLYDLYTINKHLGRIGELKVGLCGDLRFGRTVHSLSYALARFGSEIICIAPEDLELPEHVIQRLELKYKRKVSYAEKLDDVIGDLDVLYMTRIQKERLPEDIDYRSVASRFVINKALMSKAKKQMILLHPLPRVDEITYEIDDDQRAFYFRQSAYGVRVRMALTAIVLDVLKIPTTAGSMPSSRLVTVKKRCVNPRCVVNHEPYLTQKFEVISDLPPLLACVYCGEKPVDEDSDTNV
jgi:aspartate carbamoyltransferase catalytic subunit